MTTPLNIARRNSTRALIALLVIVSLSGFGSEKKCGEVAKLARNPALHALVQRYKAFGLVGPRDNARFLDIGEQTSAGANKGWVFLDVELTVLKELNDRVFGDKDVVTALSNMYKELFFERLNRALVAKPELAALFAGKYSDFKSIRLAFDGRAVPAEKRAALERLLNGVYEETATAFSAEVKKEPALTEFLESAHGISKDPQWWHLGGLGHTADLAGRVGRDSRTLFDAEAKPRLRTFEERRVALDAKVATIHDLRVSMVGLAPRESEILEASRFNADQPILSADAIDIFRKAKGDDLPTYLTNVQVALQKRFNTKVSRAFVEAAKKYLTEIDGFSPGVNAVERVVIDHETATHGEVSVDFAGQGARNLRETMSDLAAAHASGKGAEEAVKLARLGERRATLEMREMKDSFEAVCKGVFGEKGGDYYFSGDDGIFMPRLSTARDITLKDKMALVRGLAASKFRGNYRLTFLPREAPPEKRSRLIVQSETLEKNIRKELEGKVDRDVLKRLLIAPEPVLIGDRVILQVYLAGHKANELELRAMVRDAISKSLPEGCESGALISVYPEGRVIPFPNRRLSLPVETVRSIENAPRRAFRLSARG